MLLSAAGLAYLSLLATIWGAAVLDTGARALNLDGDRAPSVPSSAIGIVGLVSLSVMAGYVSLFAPLSLEANLLVLLMSCGLVIVSRAALKRVAEAVRDRVKHAHPVVLVALLLVSVQVLIEVTAVPKVGDSGLYHIQTVKWLESFRVVPGLGNLHGFFAWNSMWFPVQALAGFSFVSLQSLHVANGALYLFAAGYFLTGVEDLLRGTAGGVSVAKATAIPFTLFVYKPQIGSPATDLPVALLVMVALLLIAEYGRLPMRFDTSVFVSFLLSLFAVTVKLAAAPIMVMWIVILYRVPARVRTRALAATAIVSLVVLLPWLARNVVLSGYLVYPLESIDLFDVDWKLPGPYVESERLATQGWSRLPGSEWEASLAMPAWEWIPRWYAWLPYHYRIVVTLTALIGMVSAVIAALRPMRIRGAATTSSALMLAAGTAWAGVGYWFVTAPDPRFAFGFMFVAMMLPLALILRGKLQALRLWGALGLVTVAVLYALNHLALSVATMPPIRDVLVLPARYPNTPLATAVVDGFVLYLPISSDQCWDASLPCMPVLNEGLQARGTTLQDGFRIRNE